MIRHYPVDSDAVHGYTVEVEIGKSPHGLLDNHLLRVHNQADSGFRTISKQIDYPFGGCKQVIDFLVDLFRSNHCIDLFDFLGKRPDNRLNHVFFNIADQFYEPSECFRQRKKPKRFARRGTINDKEIIIFLLLVVAFDIGKREQLFHAGQNSHLFSINAFYSSRLHQLCKVFTDNVPVQVEVTKYTDFLSPEIFSDLDR